MSDFIHGAVVALEPELFAAPDVIAMRTVQVIGDMARLGCDMATLECDLLDGRAWTSTHDWTVPATWRLHLRARKS